MTASLYFIEYREVPVIGGGIVRDHEPEGDSTTPSVAEENAIAAFDQQAQIIEDRRGIDPSDDQRALRETLCDVKTKQTLFQEALIKDRHARIVQGRKRVLEEALPIDDRNIANGWPKGSRPAKRRRTDERPVARELRPFIVRPNIDLIDLAHRWGHPYSDKMFRHVMANFDNPRGVATVPAAGNVVIAGTKTVGESAFILGKVMLDIGKLLGVTVRAEPGSFAVRNMAGSAILPHGVDIVGMADANPSICNDNDKNFSASTLRIPTLHPITVLVFNSGKLVITGARSVESMLHAFNEAVVVIKEYAL